MPQLVPILTITGLLFPLFLTIAVWPIWGFWTLPYMFILSMGGFFSLFFLPGGLIGTLLFWVLLLAIATLSHELPHAGHEHAW